MNGCESMFASGLNQDRGSCGLMSWMSRRQFLEQGCLGDDRVV
jgi:hypothetical protein